MLLTKWHGLVSRMKENRWLRLAISLVILIGLSFGLVWLLQEAGALFHLPMDKVA
jgi:hypothetical protein